MTRYATPAAFRRALTDRLRALSDHSKWTLPQLRRQFAYDRLLERLYMMDDGWIVKGAVALLARDIGVRGSLDIDVYRAKAADGAEADLREAASRGIDDWFRFEIGPRRAVGDESSAVRLPVVAYIGQQEWERFQIDLVGSDLRMTGEPDDVPAIARIDIPSCSRTGIARTRSLTMSPTRSPQHSSCTAPHDSRRRAIATSSTCSRSRPERQSMPSSSYGPCGRRPSDGA
jgi:hypothetical protein